MAKPASGTALDTGHALYTGLAACFWFPSGDLTADATGTRSLTIDGACSQGTDANGDSCLAIPSALSAPAALSSALSLAGNGDWSLAWRGKTTNADAQGMVLGNNGNTSDFLWMFNSTALRVRDSAGGDVDPTSSLTSFVTEANYVVSFDRDQDGVGRFHFYKDGVEVGTGTSGGNNDHALSINCIGNGYTGSGFALIGTLSHVYVWSGRALSSSDASALNTNPYAMFSAGGGGGSAKTLDLLTQMGQQHGGLSV
jgi:hypothetical protein